jgi:hypothetical protein
MEYSSTEICNDCHHKGIKESRKGKKIKGMGKRK